MTAKTIVITGANRGIGLALVGHLHGTGHRVIACCRTPETASELAAHGVAVIELDIADESSTMALPEAVAAHTGHIDVLVNNAAIKQAGGFEWEASAGPMPELQADALMAVLRTDVVGTLLATQALLPMLRAPGGVVANISSQLGSLAAGVGVDYAYNVSKAAINMMTVTMMRDFGATGITPVAITPGWIKTSMGGDEAPLELGPTTAEIAALLVRLDASFGGRFVDRFGADVPW
jgi:NAD(P)-dependent dehydrogenase (short-subunit alcohol dehydrogenase family)